MTMPMLVLLVVMSFSVARISRLMTEDRITESIRAWSVARWGEEGMITYLLHCGWCCGIWASMALCTVAWIGSVCTLAEAVLLLPAAAYLGQIVRRVAEG